jgi:hypothetical protein
VRFGPDLGVRGKGGRLRVRGRGRDAGNPPVAVAPERMLMLTGEHGFCAGRYARERRWVPVILSVWHHVGIMCIRRQDIWIRGDSREVQAKGGVMRGMGRLAYPNLIPPPFSSLRGKRRGIRA